MFKGLRDGYFAFGLVIGFAAGIVLLLLLEVSSPSINPDASAVSYCQGETNHCQDYQNGRPDWGYWFRRIFSMEDTLAQWVMMAFTIAAAGLLFHTLRATQQMATDTREIGQAQVRAYVTVDKVVLTIKVRDGRVFWHFEINIRNSGQSPARQVSVWVRSPHFVDQEPGGLVVDLAASSEKIGYVIGSTAGNDLDFLPNSDTDMRFIATIGVEFNDVFDLPSKQGRDGDLWTGFIAPVDGEKFELAKSGLRLDINNWKKTKQKL
jgi:hypothetical protein